MPDITSLIQSSATSPWLYLPLAIVLGALHALEPGHSKSLMAAFIVAVRGTKAQAALLGLSAAIGHSLIVWALAIAGLYLGDKLLLDKAEPWLILISGLLIIALALRLLLKLNHSSHDEHDHPHEHTHENHDAHAAAHAKDIAKRFGGKHHVTTGEIIWFGFTGGLMPCPSAIAVLLVCIQLKAWGLGVAMVFAFSIGLAVTLVSIGIVAAMGTKMASAKWSGFDEWGQRLPYISGALIMAMGLFITARGMMALGVF